MNILFVCTSNKDRSPALERYFTSLENSRSVRAYEYKSAGVNLYFTHKHQTQTLTTALVQWADVIVYAESIHKDIARRLVPTTAFVDKREIILGIGDYMPAEFGVSEDYLTRAQEILRSRGVIVNA